MAQMLAPRRPVPLSALWAVLIGQALVILAAFLTAPRTLGDSFRHWDAIHFLTIATSGYARGLDFHDAFWPGYPALVRVASVLTDNNALVAALVVSALSSALAIFWLLRWTTAEAGPKVARRAAVMLALWPTAVFLALPYSDGAFLAAAVGCVYFARSGRFGWAALAACVASAIRLPGNVLWIVVAIELAQRSGFRPVRAWLWLLLAPVPVVAFSAYLYVQTGHPLAFFDAEKLPTFSVGLVGPWTALGNAWAKAHVSAELAGIYGANVALALVAIGGVAAAVARRALPASLLAYCALMLVLILSESTWRSVDRYELGLFPLFLPLARSMRWPTWTAWVTISAVGFLILAFRFAQGGWIG